MKPNYETFLDQALELNENERSELIDMLEAIVSEKRLEAIRRSWLVEAQASADQIDQGEAALISH